MEFTAASNEFVIPPLPENTQPRFSLQPQEQLDGPVRPEIGRAFTQAEIDAAIAGKKYRLHAFGYVTYHDAFGESHETPFVVTCSGGAGLRDVLRCVQFKPEDTPRFELNTFDRKLT